MADEKLSYIYMMREFRIGAEHERADTFDVIQPRD